MLLGMGRKRSKSDIDLPIPTAAAASPSPLWIELPDDVTANILQRLGAEEILESAQKVCSTWWKLCKDPAMWRKISLKYRYSGYFNFGQLCRCAVDRSRGQLAHLSIAHLVDDELLNYVTLRYSSLRCLVLKDPGHISPLALTDAVKKLPQLEALHLIKTLALDAKDVETIGLSCPLLKSFTYKDGWVFECLNIDDNAVALAIAKTMPNLHHLRLAGDVKNEGLEAILDGCPCLELLDLRCYSLDLKAGALGERCAKQIKDLRVHIEPTYNSANYYDDGGLDYWNSDDEYGDDYYY